MGWPPRYWRHAFGPTVAVRPPGTIKENMIESLTASRLFRCFIPDITLEDAMKAGPCVLKFLVPRGSEFIRTLLVEDVSSSISPLIRGRVTLSYAFLLHVEEEEMVPVYLTSLLSEVPFPWSTEQSDLQCKVLDVSSHGGIVLLHAQVTPPATREEEFEKTVTEAGYQIVPTKPYTLGRQLHEAYLGSVNKNS